MVSWMCHVAALSVAGNARRVGARGYSKENTLGDKAEQLIRED
jgi:hypothetical protein